MQTTRVPGNALRKTDTYNAYYEISGAAEGPVNCQSGASVSVSSMPTTQNQNLYRKESWILLAGSVYLTCPKLRSTMYWAGP